jgi:hypothetical protein
MQVLWPDHCVPGTFGADFHKDLDLRECDLIIRKGNNPLIDSYSTFLENDRKTATGLHYYLQGLGIGDVYPCGLATDYCVYFSALDALEMGFAVAVLLDVSRGVDVPAGNCENAVTDMKERGVRILSGISAQGIGPGIGDEKSSLRGKVPDMKIEDRRFLHSRTEIGLQHRELVEIGQEWTRQGIHAKSFF